MIYLVREAYEPELIAIEQFLSAGQVAVDVGANCGIYTVAASKLVGHRGRVISFEPAEESFRILERNIELNRLRNVKAFRVALSDREGASHLYHIDDAPNSYSLGSDTRSTCNFEEISTVTLDTVLEQENTLTLDLLKMDVEGAEELVLRGALSAIPRWHPAIVFEVNPKAARRLGLSQNGAWELLAGLGYQFFTVKGSSELLSLSAPPQGGNVIAVHSKNLS